MLDIVFHPINFISTSYGDRTSDIFVFEKCVIIDKLPSNCVVMADCDFKKIASLLKKKNCQRLRPPPLPPKLFCFKTMFQGRCHRREENYKPTNSY